MSYTLPTVIENPSKEAQRAWVEHGVGFWEFNRMLALREGHCPQDSIAHAGRDFGIAGVRLWAEERKKVIKFGKSLPKWLKLPGRADMGSPMFDHAFLVKERKGLWHLVTQPYWSDSLPKLAEAWAGKYGFRVVTCEKGAPWHPNAWFVEFAPKP